MPTDIYIVIQVLPDSVLAVEVLLSCTGCAVATWLGLRLDRSQAYADWTCLHQLQHLCISTVYAAADAMSHRLQHIFRSCSAGILLVRR